MLVLCGRRASILWRASLLGAILSVPVATSGQTMALEAVKVETNGHPALSADFDLRVSDSTFVPAGESLAVTIDEGGTTVTGVVGPTPSVGTTYLVVVDVSPSMRRVLPKARAALAEWVSRLPQSDRVGLALVGEDARVLAQPKGGRAQIGPILDQIRVEGRRTELFFGLFNALKEFAVDGPQRRIVVVISDGIDGGKAYTLDDAIAQARAANMTFAGLGVASDPAAALVLQRLAVLTGGPYTLISRPEDWTGALANVDRFAGGRRQVRWQSRFPRDGQARPIGLHVDYRGQRVSASGNVAMPAPLPPPEVVWWKRQVLFAPLWVVGLLGAVIVSTAAIGGVMLRSKTRARIASLDSNLLEERRRRQTAEDDLKDQIDGVARQVEERAAASAASPFAPMPHPSPTPVAAIAAPKAKTVFQSRATSVLVKYGSATIVIESGPLVGARIPLPERGVTIGRNLSNQIVVDDPKVSGEHATIEPRQGIFWLRDLDSTNGTYVDGSRVSLEVPLVAGQMLRVGDVDLRFDAES